MSPTLWSEFRGASVLKTADRSSPATLTSKQRRCLRGLAHGMAAVVQVGKQGFTPAVGAQLDAALKDHELIKVRLDAERSARPAIVAVLLEATGAEHVGSIGHVVILYRRRDDAEGRSIVLPA